MNSSSSSISSKGGSDPTTTCHVVAMLYPGRGHITPMMSLCRLLVSKSDHIFITLVVTEDWLGFVTSELKDDHHRFRFCSIPNVLPSEVDRAANPLAVMEAVWTKMEAPFEYLLDQLNPPPTFIIADTFLFWAVSLGNRRNIPVASFWPMSARIFSVFHHFHLFRQNGHFPVNVLEMGEERVDYIPGISSTPLLDLPPVDFSQDSASSVLNQMLNSVSMVRQAQYLLFSSIYELEPMAVDTFKAEFPLPVYTIGPAIPYLELAHGNDNVDRKHNYYLEWLDKQLQGSVLYVSLGSSSSTVPSAQMDEFAAGLNESGVRFLWVVRHQDIDDAPLMKVEAACGDGGLVVPWCDQLRVLTHPSIGGFWSNCGWNSVQEGIFAGVPFLTCPLIADQKLNSKLIVEDWKIGWLAKNVTTRGEIARLVGNFMDSRNEQVKGMRERAKELKQKCQHAIGSNGSSQTSINSLITNILQSSK